MHEPRLIPTRMAGAPISRAQCCKRVCIRDANCVAITEFVGYAIRNEAVRSELAQRYRQLHATILHHLPPRGQAREIAWAIIALSHGMKLLAYILPTVEMGEHYDELLELLMMGSNALPTLGDAMQPE